MVETGTDVACHFQVLDLVTAYGHVGTVENQNVGRHQHRIAKQAHFHAVVHVFLARIQIRLHRGFVSMGAVHQAFGADAIQNPIEFHDFGNVGLAVKSDVLWVKSASQPSGGHSQG